MGNYLINKKGNNATCLDLTEILWVLKMVQQRLILSVIFCNCTVVCLPPCLVKRQHIHALQRPLDRFKPLTALQYNIFQPLCAIHMMVYFLSDNLRSAIINVRRPKNHLGLSVILQEGQVPKWKTIESCLYLVFQENQIKNLVPSCKIARQSHHLY